MHTMPLVVNIIRTRQYIDWRIVRLGKSLYWGRYDWFSAGCHDNTCHQSSHDRLSRSQRHTYLYPSWMALMDDTWKIRQPGSTSQTCRMGSSTRAPGGSRRALALCSQKYLGKTVGALHWYMYSYWPAITEWWICLFAFRILINEYVHLIDHTFSKTTWNYHDVKGPYVPIRSLAVFKRHQMLYLHMFCN